MKTFRDAGAAGLLAQIKAKLTAFGNPDATPLMISWQLIIREDNRKGVLAGLDKDGNPMQPVTYRPKLAPGEKPTNIRSKAAARLRNNQNPRRMHNLLFAGHGPWASGLHNNLSPAEYRKLTGPPLAPRGQFSRVITNLVTGWEPPQPGAKTKIWTAFGAWKDVVSVKGIAFLVFHFTGQRLGRHGPSIKRDLRGVRPDGRQRLRESYLAWAADHVRSSVNG